MLTSEYVKHFSQGLMHGDTNHVDVDTEHLQIISTCKHFAGYDIETGRSGNNVNISARMLTEYYLPVFKTCVQVAKVKSIMCSYNGEDGASLRIDVRASATSNTLCCFIWLNSCQWSSVVCERQISE